MEKGITFEECLDNAFREYCKQNGKDINQTEDFKAGAQWYRWIIMAKLSAYRLQLSDAVAEHINRANAPDSSPIGSARHRGFADGHISSRAMLEEMFDFWN